MPPKRNTAILRAAAEEVAAVGLRRTSLTDVARRAGVSRMTVYREYGDAATLWRALVTAEIEQVVREAEQAAAGQPTSRARLVTASRAAVRRLTAHPLLVRVRELDPDQLLPFLFERLGSGQRAARARLLAALHDGARDGSVARPDLAAAADVVLLAAQAAVLSAQLAERPDAVADELAVMLDAYLASPATLEELS